ncbi:hypothetical protein [Flavisphingomonas formosensis]|uniref:hypothetical protein n=1 Tax=Flavisphingomonas formosensis TaxID=861534 RepID=UPI0012FBCE9E|nr:hypothetical protein [Sphingomonas formosensis]
MSNPVKQAADRASSYAGEKLGSARDKVGATVENAKASLSDAGESAMEAIGDNPGGAVVGALALGALIGALLPRTSAETRMLGPIGGRLNAAAKDAASAAREAGVGKLAELGLTKEAARQNAGKLIGNALLAAVTAGDAAVIAARHKKEAEPVTEASPAE